MKTGLRANVLVSTFVLLCSTGTCQDNTDAQSRVEEVTQWAKSTVASLKFRDAASDTEFQPHSRSLIRWTNPVIGQVYGDSFLWLDKGRPAVFLSIYALYERDAGHRRLTFQSLHEQPVTGSLGGTDFWSPDKPGLSFRPLDGQQKPSTRVAQRRLQMRRIAGQFKGSIQEDDAERQRELRLLPKPLYPYRSSNDGPDDGAIFAFADSTDPELLLLIEVRETGGTPSWHYAPVRQNHRRLELKHNDKLIWEAEAVAPPWGNNPKIDSPQSIYFNIPWKRIDRLAPAE